MGIGVKEIVFAVIILAIIALAAYVFSNIMRTVRKAAGEVKHVVDMVDKATDREMNTPKSLAGVETLMLEKIKRDYPDFDINATRAMVESAVMNYFQVINTKDGLSHLSAVCTPALVEEIGALAQNSKNVYNDVKLHRTVISDYRKNMSEGIVTFQTALQYTLNDKIQGQYVYVSKLINYLSEDNDDKVLTVVRCQYCGGTLQKRNGEYFCPYCGETQAGSLSVERIWRVSDIRRLR